MNGPFFMAGLNGKERIMARLTAGQDAYGQAMWDYAHGKSVNEIIERDDGWVVLSPGPATYMAEHKDWPAFERKAIALARGKVLDVGCGAGRVALYLQGKGLDVVGIDNSPLAIKLCRKRGVKTAKVMSVTQLSRRLGMFDTIVMYGNNFGLMGNVRRARWLLRRFRNMTSDAGRILAHSADPYQTDVPEHLAYHRRNKRRGRMGGQIRLRDRYKTFATPYHDYLLVSQDEMARIVAGAGWRIARTITDESGYRYVAALEKEPVT